AAAMPLPSEDTTPPVTKIRGVMSSGDGWKTRFYRHRAPAASERLRSGDGSSPQRAGGSTL
ncbi:MAG TPA: hypothetical protein VM847_15430, partial [Tahibacter sp.]|nr:hypothetical protein [Tahibacter sp.]